MSGGFFDPDYARDRRIAELSKRLDRLEEAFAMVTAWIASARERSEHLSPPSSEDDGPGMTSLSPKQEAEHG